MVCRYWKSYLASPNVELRAALVCHPTGTGKTGVIAG
ncbi:MAG: hypothetical protein JO136_09325 [Hyphomicrobiales bacterium]|nr:hypothetical protein [Hyphomicrobiales bacterium]MBV9906539.1 hypothetical protein [Hyphomicrobiales bacterium]